MSPETPDPQDFNDPSPNPEGDGELAGVCAALRRYAVTRLVVRYAGSEDDGGVEEVVYEPEEAPVPQEINDRLQDVAETYCPDGYEDNHGGYGSLTLYPFAGLAVLKHTARYEDAEEAEVRATPLPARLRRRLSRLGITGVTARFDGYGDEGSIEEFVAQPETAVLGRRLEDDLEDFLLDRLPGGWEDGEGGFGDFVLDVAGGTVRVVAYWRVEKVWPPQIIRWKWRQ
jgi:hypothetical protein